MALDGTYAITVVLGGKSRSGTAEIMSYEDTVWLTLKAPVLGTVEATGALDAQGYFTASGSLRVMLKRISYNLRGHVEGDTLFVDVDTNMGSLPVKGSRIA